MKSSFLIFLNYFKVGKYLQPDKGKSIHVFLKTACFLCVLSFHVAAELHTHLELICTEHFCCIPELKMTISMFSLFLDNVFIILTVTYDYFKTFLLEIHKSIVWGKYRNLFGQVQSLLVTCTVSIYYVSPPLLNYAFIMLFKSISLSHFTGHLAQWVELLMSAETEAIFKRKSCLILPSRTIQISYGGRQVALF